MTGDADSESVGNPANFGTLIECDVARDLINSDIASIEFQLADPRSRDRGLRWRALATAALRHKKAMLQKIQDRRGEIRRKERAEATRRNIEQANTRNRLLLDIIKRDFPTEFRAAVDTLDREIKASH
jgi:hypothetical protein